MLSLEDPRFLELAQKSHYGDVMMGSALIGMVWGNDPKTVLEYGTYRGFSTCAIASVLSLEGKIWTIDRNDQTEARGWVERFDFQKLVEFRRSVTWEFKHEVDTYDLIFLDASHDYKGWRQEVLSVLPHMNDFSLLAVHDTPELSDWKKVERELLYNFQSMIFPNAGLTFFRAIRGEQFPLGLPGRGGCPDSWVGLQEAERRRSNA